MDIFLDGKMNGIECASFIKKSLDIPVIFLASPRDEKEIEKANELNPYGYIMKPYDEYVLKINVQLAFKRFEFEKGLERKYQFIFENAPIGILLADKNGNILEANTELLKILGSPSLEQTKKINLFSYPPLIEAGIADEARRVFSSKKESEFFMDYITRWGKKLYMALLVKPLIDAQGEVELLQVIIQDMSQKKELQASLIENGTKFSGFIENSFDGIVLTDEEGKIEIWNPAMEKITRVSQDKAKGRKIWELQYEMALANRESAEKESLETLKNNVMKVLQGKNRDQKKVFIRDLMVDEKKIYIQTAYFPVKTSKGYIYASINWDMTDLFAYQEKLIKAKEEKEVLIQEIHHRVKNNLQIISGLLGIEQGRSQNAELKNTLQNCISRIESIALIHNELYHREDFPTLNMPSFLDNFSRYLNTIYSKPGFFVTIQVTSDDIQISLAHAVPCGLIMNELLTNALKYAFLGKEEGMIDIVFKKLENGNLFFCVKDNGNGLPKNFSLADSKGLGLTLVKKLSHQLKGKLDIKTGLGTEISIEFKG